MANLIVRVASPKADPKSNIGTPLNLKIDFSKSLLKDEIEADRMLKADQKMWVRRCVNTPSWDDYRRDYYIATHDFDKSEYYMYDPCTRDDCS